MDKSTFSDQCKSNSLSQYIDDALEWAQTPEDYDRWCYLYSSYLNRGSTIVNILPLIEYKFRHGPFGSDCAPAPYVALKLILNFTERFKRPPSIKLIKTIILAMKPNPSK